MKTLGASRMTVHRALRELTHEGRLIRVQGVGTFVAPGYEQRLESGLERLESILDLATRQRMKVSTTGPTLKAWRSRPPGASCWAGSKE